MRRASAITIFSGFTTRRTDDIALIREDLLHVVEVAVEALHRGEHLVARDRQRRHPRDDRPYRLHHLALHGEDPLDVPVHDLRERQQSERLRRRRAVHHEHVVAPALHVRLHVDQGEDLVETGDHRELLGLDRLGPGPVHQLDEVVLDLAPVVLEPFLGVDLLRPEVLRDQRGRDSICSSKESPRECAGSVDITSVRLPERAARTAVAAATVVFPTPPFPVNSTTRMSRAYVASRAPGSRGS